MVCQNIHHGREHINVRRHNKYEDEDLTDHKNISKRLSTDDYPRVLHIADMHVFELELANNMPAVSRDCSDTDDN